MVGTVNHPHDDQEKKLFFIEHVARFCDKCGRGYEPDDIVILQQNEYSVIIHFACPMCKAQHLATFIKPLGVTSRVPVNTDLSVDELGKFAGKRSVSSNDVLDAHELMKNPEFTVQDLLKLAKK